MRSSLLCAMMLCGAVAGTVSAQGQICPLPPPPEVPICQQMQPNQCITGIPGQTCLPRIIIIDNNGFPFAELCECFDQTSGCGPIRVTPTPIPEDFNLSCDNLCPPGQNCEVFRDGLPTGQTRINSFGLPPGTVIECHCVGQPQECPLASGICAPLQSLDCLGSPNDVCEAICVEIVDGPQGTPEPVAQQCTCIPTDDNGCGPVRVTPIPGTNDFNLTCEGDCPPGAQCEVLLDGNPSGQTRVNASEVPVGTEVKCACVDQPPPVCPLATQICAPLQTVDCQGGPNDECEALCVRIVTGPGGVLQPVAEQCSCVPFDDNSCGPVTVTESPAVGEFNLTCEGDCPPGAQCEVTINGIPSGMTRVNESDVQDGDQVKCECVDAPPVCPLATEICAPLQTMDCLGGPDDLCEAICVRILQGPTGLTPVAEQCSCIPVDDNNCGPVTVTPIGPADPPTDWNLTCEGICPPGAQCEVTLNGVPTGQTRVNASEVAPDTQVKCECVDQPPPACPLATPICAPLQDTDCLGGPDDLCEAICVRIVQGPTGLQPFAELCSCIPSDDNTCGPVQVTPIAGTNDFNLTCEGICPPGAQCEVTLDGMPSGQTRVNASELVPGTQVKCECVDTPPVCPLATDICAPLQDTDCLGGPDDLCEAICVRIVDGPQGIAEPIAELCSCIPQDDESCGPVTINPIGPLPGDYNLSCEGICPPNAQCQILLNGGPSGQSRVNASEVPIGTQVKCGCVDVEVCPLPTPPTVDPCATLQFSDCLNPMANEVCRPRCVNYDPNSGTTTVLACDCRDFDECHVEFQPGTDPFCEGGCPPGEVCVETLITHADGTIDICCDCEPEPGACCYDTDGDGIDETCSVVSALDCAVLGGTFHGPGSNCLGAGACCYDADFDGINETCEVMDALCCSDLGGAFQGVGTLCQAPGACCFDTDGDGVDESCIVMSGSCCDDIPGATFHGAGSTCADNNGNMIADVCEEVCTLPPGDDICLARQPIDCLPDDPNQVCLPRCVIIEGVDEVRLTFDKLEPGPIEVPAVGQVVTGDRVCIIGVGPATNPTQQTRIDNFFRDTGPVTMTFQFVDTVTPIPPGPMDCGPDRTCDSPQACRFDALDNLALGGAALNISPPADCNLVVSNIGSSGKDGVRQDPLPPGTTRMASGVGLPNFSLAGPTTQARFLMFADIPGELLSELSVQCPDGQFLEARGDVTPGNVSSYTVQIWNNDNLAGEFEGLTDPPSVRFPKDDLEVVDCQIVTKHVPVAQLCDCFDPDAGNCGPVQVTPIPGTNDWNLSCEGICPPGADCQVTLDGMPTGTDRVLASEVPVGSEVKCDCVDVQLCPLPAPNDICSALQGSDCVDPDLASDQCLPTCVNFDPATGQVTALECDCRGPDECHVEFQGAALPMCVGNCPPGEVCVETLTDNPVLGGVDICCTCEPAPGACCFDADGDGIDDSCIITTLGNCNTLGGTFQPGGSCGPIGACCFDADGDGINDTCAEMPENCCTGTFQCAATCTGDLNGDGLDDRCTCPADLNGDGVVNAADLALLLGRWGACPTGCCAQDLNGDGVVNAADLALLLGSWGAC